MSDLDTLLAQALALVSEDKRGQLAAIIEAIIEQAQAMPPYVFLSATGPALTDVVGVYDSMDALYAHAARKGLKPTDAGVFKVQTMPTP